MHSNINTEELLAWIRLSLEPGLGPAQARSLLAAIGLPHKIYSLPVNMLRKHIPEQLAHQISQPAPTAISKKTEETLEWLTKNNHYIITLADPNYPAKLLDITDPPLLLYAKGDITQLEHQKLAIVGARSATAAGIENAMAFAKHLALSGWSVVSGLALGIDTAAHQGALQAHASNSAASSTIAILATGIDMVYPARNHSLAHKIANSGLLLTELPLGTKALPYQFPRRNRIVAGLSNGVLVVEAARQSGSLITATLAAEFGREVFAIPGSIHSPLSRGCHYLIRQGAKLVESANDITEELGQPTLFRLIPPNKINLESTTKKSNNKLSNTQSIVLDALGYDPTHPDLLIERTGLSMAQLTEALLKLQLEQKISRLIDGCYQRI